MVLDLCHIEAVSELDGVVTLAGREQARVKVGAVKGEIGRAVALLGDVAKRHGGECAARDCHRTAGARPA